MTMYRGSCLCQGVTFQAAELSKDYVYCHCKSCRKANGTAFAANAAAPLEGFQILSGADLITRYESSPQKFRHFCRVCGTPLFTKVGDNPEFVRIRLGTLDTSFGEPRSAHIFVAEKAPWYEIADSTPQYAGWPDPETLAIPGSRQDDS
ncbi:MAG: GFA family protein [Pseudomonadota bacterium]